MRDMTFRTKDPKILGAAIKNAVAMATWHPGCVPPGTFMTYLLTVTYLAAMIHYVQTTNRNVKEYSQGSHLIILSTYCQIPSSDDALCTDNKSKRKRIFARQPPDYFIYLLSDT